MDMGSSSSSSTNITNLPLSDPRCNSDKCLAFKAGHTASQAQISWASQFLYGHYTTWYYLAVIGVSMIIHAYRKLQRLETFSTGGSTSISNKAVALIRSVSYRRLHGRIGDYWRLPSLGVLIFVAFTSLYLLLLTFVQRPYYRLRRGFGSPPLAVRTGLMAIALTPIIVALAGKVNIITLLTGISHEKLNALHRYTSYLCLFLSIVHTVPFIVAPLKDGGYQALHAQYYKAGGMEYTGTPPFAMLVALALFSIPWIRTNFYNLFYRLHIPLYIIYLGLMFWHAAQELDSWAYLWATLAIWLASVAARAFIKWQTFNIFRSPWGEGFPVEITRLEGGMTRADVLVPASFQWKEGQHAWLRFPHLSLLQNHPFTIASLPNTIYGEDEKRAGEYQNLRFYIRSYKGLTKSLAATTEKHERSLDARYTVHIDGPYGGRVQNLPQRFDQIIFVAGGGGISAVLPLLLSTSLAIARGKAFTNSIRLVWMVREERMIEWVRDELNDAIELANGAFTGVDFFVTDQKIATSTSRGNAESESKEEGIETTLLGKEVTPSVQGTSLVAHSHTYNERPFLIDALPRLITGRRVLLFGCGPESLKIDLSNLAAREQRRVLSGEANEIALHTETFGW